MKKHIVSKLTDTEWYSVFRQVKENKAKGISTAQTLKNLGIRSTHYAYARTRLMGIKARSVTTFTATTKPSGFVQYVPANGAHGNVEVQVGGVNGAKISVPSGNTETLKWVLQTVGQL